MPARKEGASHTTGGRATQMGAEIAQNRPAAERAFIPPRDGGERAPRVCAVGGARAAPMAIARQRLRRPLAQKESPEPPLSAPDAPQPAVKSSCPRWSRASTSWSRCSNKDVDGRNKSGHDEAWCHSPRRRGNQYHRATALRQSARTMSVSTGSYASADNDITAFHAAPRYRIGRPGAMACAAAMIALASMP